MNNAQCSILKGGMRMLAAQNLERLEHHGIDIVH
jgi:hypothetical protein